MDALDKELPSAPDAEKAILGAIIMNPDLARDIIPTLRSDDFYIPTHRDVFAAICEFLDAGKEIDQILLAQHIHDKGITYVTLPIIKRLSHAC